MEEASNCAKWRNQMRRLPTVWLHLYKLKFYSDHVDSWLRSKLREWYNANDYEESLNKKTSISSHTVGFPNPDPLSFVGKMARRSDKFSFSEEWVRTESCSSDWLAFRYFLTYANFTEQRLKIIQKVQINCFFVTCPGLQAQSQLECTDRTDFIFIITPISPI